MIGVAGSFTAAHRCAEPELHVHRWHVMAWFEPPARVDARLYQAALDMLLKGWEGRPLPVEVEWQEDLARAVGTLVNCVEVQVSRPDDNVYTRWLS